MNKSILNIEIQDFIKSNLSSNISDLILKGSPFSNIDIKEIVEQIEAKTRCQKKLPTWFNTNNIYYPNKLNIEQTSSEVTAGYKAKLVSGKFLIDITGGFGVDTFYFSKCIEHVTHCEINPKLSKIVKHNYSVLNVSNIDCKKENGIEVLKHSKNIFDWIFIDPSRRDEAKKKVFLLSDSTPNAIEHQGLFFEHANNIMIKTSPLLDIKATLLDLDHVKEIHIIAINNEVKEMLWILQKNVDEVATIKTINFQNNSNQIFNFNPLEESEEQAEYSEPLKYLYEPNSAILKSGAFNSVSHKLNIPKLHKHSHLYTSDTIIDFPGRRFKINKQLHFNKKTLSKEGITKANIATRNFPLSVSEIRKKFKINDGGNVYLFFTTDLENQKTILICSKM